MSASSVGSPRQYPLYRPDSDSTTANGQMLHDGAASDSSSSDRWRAGAHFRPLDGIRGVAILLVLVLHFAEAIQPATRLDRAFQHVTGWTWLGVDLFFVLSGFLITGILLDSVDDPKYYRTFYARRALRIFPLYYAFLASLAWIVLPAIRLATARGLLHEPSTAWMSDSAASHPGLWLYLTNYTIAVQGWRAVPAFTAALWSLAVEEQFYLAWPAVVRRVTRRTLLLLACAAIPAALCIRASILHAQWWTAGAWSSEAAYVFPFGRFDTLAMGAIIAIAMRDATLRARLRRWLPALALAGTGLITAVLVRRNGFYSWDPGVERLGMTGSVLACGSLVAWCVLSSERSLLNRVLDARVLQQFGKYSYAIYIFHPFIRWLIEPTYRRFAGLTFGSSVPCFLVYVVVAMSICLFVGWLSWHAIEKRCLALKRYFPSHGEVAAARARRSRPHRFTPRTPIAAHELQAR
jgi:peptidoglycan/LPS O-acetylase OafA/YrhL